MATMPVFSIHGFHGEGEIEGCMRSYLDDSPLPAFYMGDFSILGLLVDDLPKVREILSKRDYLASSGPDGGVSLVDLADLPEIIRLLEQESIGCEIADLVKEVYQA
ncbi:MAG: hypothetical protein ACLGPL_03735 [Acidobacteriota bacterium]